MLKWLSDNPDAAITVLTLIGGWLGITKKKANTSALKDKLLARLRKAVLDLIEEHATVERARVMLHRAANELIEDLGVKRTATVEALIEPLIEQALKEYQERLGPIVLRMRIEELFGAVSKLPEAFAAPAKPLGLEQPLLEGMNVEVVKP